MANWYVDNVGGNDSNDGTTTGTAVASLRGLAGKNIQSMDTIKIKRTNTPYTLTPLNVPATDIIVTSISTGIILVDWYDGDTVMPELIFSKDTSNPTYGCNFVGGNTKVITSNLDQKWDVSGTTNTTIAFAWSMFNNSQSFTYNFNVKKTFFKSDNLTTSHNARDGGSGGSSDYNCRLEYVGAWGVCNTPINCWGNFNGNPNSFALMSGNRLIYKAYANTSAVAAMVTSILQNNTILFDKDAGGGSYTNLHFLTHPATTNGWDTANFNNLFITKSGSAANIYGYRSASAANVPPGMNGNNVFGGLTSLTNNITGNPEGLPASFLTSFDETLFKSLDPDSPDFLIVDETVSGVDTYIRGKGLGGADIGARPLTPVGAGETDPDKVLKTSLVVAGKIDPDKLMEDDESGNGLLSLEKVLTTAGGDYVPADKTKYKSGESFGVAEIGEYDPVTGNWEAVTPEEMIAGASKKQNGLTVTGVQVVPAGADVRKGVNTGTTAGTCEVPATADVRKAVPVDNTVGDLDVEAEANLPLETDVVAGSPNFGPDLDKVPSADVDSLANLPDPAWVDSSQPAFGKNEDIIPSFVPDFASPENVLENDTTNNVPGEVPLSAVKETSGGDLPLNKIAPSEGGEYVGEESNTELNEEDVVLGKNFINLGVEKTGTAAGTETDYPDEEVVLNGVAYAFGLKTGRLGAINGSGLDFAREAGVTAGVFIQSLLGADWEPLRYFKEVEKNDFNNNAKKWGIRVLTDTLTDEKFGGKNTLDLDFEIKLTTDFDNRDGDDFEREAELDLINKMEAIRRQLIKTKFYANSSVRIVKNWNRQESEKIGNNVVLLVANFTVNFDINNG